MADITHEFSDIQCVVRGFGRRFCCTRFLYVRIGNGAHGLAFLTWLGPPTSIEQRMAPEPGDVYWNLALTFRGLQALGLGRAAEASLPDAFREGMAARAADNGDDGDSAPEEWDAYWRVPGIDLWLGIYAETDAGATNLEHDWRAAIAANAWDVEIVAVQTAAHLAAGDTPLYLDDDRRFADPELLVEHFGFHDGVTNPAVHGIWDAQRPTPSLTRVPGNGKFEDGRWRPLAAGEFLFGYVDELHEVPVAPLPNELAHNGSFMVYRKLHQNVDRFHDYVRAQAIAAGVRPDYVAEKMIGRRREGRSFNDPCRDNNFLFDADHDGRRCPLGAHIRRANPRDTLGFESRLVDRHRILRRSVPYGELVGSNQREADVNDPAEGQGLIFIGLCASLTRQFEFIQRQWINFGNDFSQGDDRDPVVGSHDGTGGMVIPPNAWDPGDATTLSAGEPAVFCRQLPPFVQTRGGDYFFLPGIEALRRLLRGDFA